MSILIIKCPLWHLIECESEFYDEDAYETHMKQIHPRCPKFEKRIDYSLFEQSSNKCIDKWKIYLLNRSRSHQLKDWSKLLMNECHPEIGNKEHKSRGFAKKDQEMTVLVTLSETYETKRVPVPYFLKMLDTERNEGVDKALSDACLDVEYPNVEDAKESRVDNPQEVRRISSKRSMKKKNDYENVSRHPSNNKAKNPETEISSSTTKEGLSSPPTEITSLLPDPSSSSSIHPTEVIRIDDSDEEVSVIDYSLLKDVPPKLVVGYDPEDRQDKSVTWEINFDEGYNITSEDDPAILKNDVCSFCNYHYKVKDQVIELPCGHFLHVSCDFKSFEEMLRKGRCFICQAHVNKELTTDLHKAYESTQNGTV